MIAEERHKRMPDCLTYARAFLSSSECSSSESRLIFCHPDFPSQRVSPCKPTTLHFTKVLNSTIQKQMFNHPPNMSEIQQATNKTPKMNSKRRTWVRERRQVQVDRGTPEQPDRSAEEETISGVPSPTSVRRRASVQDSSTSSTLLTPPTVSEERSTKSCPPSAIRITLNPPALESTSSEPVEGAAQLVTPNTTEIVTQTAVEDTSEVDSTGPSHTTEIPASVSLSTGEHQTFATLANRNFHIPLSASLNTSSLILFKHDTPSLERFRLLHNQLFIELARVVEEQFQSPPFPETNAEAYKQREDLMLGLLTEVVPALNHLTETIGKEVKSSIQNHNAGLRLWVGERDQKKEERS